ncbi:MAG: phosphoenolpyruvate--protein phosphotransferase [Puniceicoccales bacterium]|jgi:phosphotransferase system enzyme I (PtsI)|nr:phosphoenolpyruvate--protein phosphotransferase [Puniceicoccales bacterium]
MLQTAPNTIQKQEILIRGIAAAPGIAQGPAFVFLQDGLDVPCYPVEEAALSGEIGRFEQALLATRKQISLLRDAVIERLGQGEAAIFDAHLLALEDPALIDETIQTVYKKKLNIEHCFHAVAEKYIAFFSKLEDEYFKERVSDIRDVAQRILRNMLGLSKCTLSAITDRRVIVAEDVTPSDTATLEIGHAIAIITDAGNRTSHAVIMSRSLRIPAVVGLISASHQIEHDDAVIVDGYEGLVIVNPTDETLASYERISRSRGDFQRKVLSEVELPSLTSDGVPFRLSANVNGVEDIESVHKYRAGGVGLFRTESIFLKNSQQVPDEETQFDYYRALIAAALPDRVIVRTLDIGGDKQHSALLAGTGSEPNPFMGFRAIRYCLERKPDFRTQLRAILRASAYGRVKIMFPMISSLDELLQAKDFLAQTAAELKAEGVAFDENIAVGSMIEIPSAAVSAELLADHCDFFSIGTNDLVQYMLAVDRGNERIAHLYEPCNPAVLQILRHVIQTAKRKKIDVSVCGELAGDSAFAPLLFALGADSLSMTPAVIPEMRYLLRRSNSTDLNELVSQVYSEHDPKKIYQILRRFANERLV